MNIDLLKTSLHIDQVHVWNELNRIVSDSKDVELPNSDITREYYLGLITDMLCCLKREAVRDSKQVQTESCLNSEIFKKSLDIMEKNNEILDDYWGSVSNMIMYPHSGISLPNQCLDGFDWSTASNTMKQMGFCLDELYFGKFIQLLEEKDALLTNIISSQHLMLVSQKQTSSPYKHDESHKSIFTSRSDEVSRLKMELEHLKSQNERLNIRLELYRSELARIFNKNESSCFQPPILN